MNAMFQSLRELGVHSNVRATLAIHDPTGKTIIGSTVNSIGTEEASQSQRDVGRECGPKPTES